MKLLILKKGEAQYYNGQKHTTTDREEHRIVAEDGHTVASLWKGKLELGPEIVEILNKYL